MEPLTQSAASCCTGISRTAAAMSVPRITLTGAPPSVSAVHIPGGRAHVGTDAPVQPQHRKASSRMVMLQPFRIDAFAVSNDRFAAVVAASEYATEAERIGWSLVFRGLALSATEVTLSQSGPAWWCCVEGASWHRPEGPGSRVTARAIPSSTFLGRMPRPSPPGLRPPAKPIGSMPQRAANLRRAIHGVTPNQTTRASNPATSGRVNFQTSTQWPRATPVPRPSMSSGPMALACSAFAATFGSGAPSDFASAPCHLRPRRATHKVWWQDSGS